MAFKAMNTKAADVLNIGERDYNSSFQAAAMVFAI